MAEQFVLSATKREALGKGPNRRLRTQDMVPVVYYNAKGENLALSVRHIALRKAYQKLGSNQILQLQVEGETAAEPRPSLFWKLQMHPTKDRIVHVDFYGVDLTKEVRVVVPVEIVGEAPGVKKGGVLEFFRDHVEVTALPLNIPEVIRIDISALEINQSVHVKDLQLPEGVKAMFDENYSLVGVVTPVAETEPGEGAGSAV